MKFYDVEVDEKTVPHVKIMETVDKLALAPVEQREDCNFIDYTNVRVYDKQEPDYPLEGVESYREV